MKTVNFWIVGDNDVCKISGWENMERIGCHDKFQECWQLGKLGGWGFSGLSRGILAK